ncbi:hypothetical protein LEMLEM_LOCUS10105 [Lemmus lemmus]
MSFQATKKRFLKEGVFSGESVDVNTTALQRPLQLQPCDEGLISSPLLGGRIRV